eukprot:10463302-Ditylum_brightwellii.AAC.1
MQQSRRSSLQIPGCKKTELGEAHLSTLGSTTHISCSSASTAFGEAHSSTMGSIYNLSLPVEGQGRSIEAEEIHYLCQNV